MGVQLFLWSRTADITPVYGRSLSKQLTVGDRRLIILMMAVGHHIRLLGTSLYTAVQYSFVQSNRGQKMRKNQLPSAL